MGPTSYALQIAKVDRLELWQVSNPKEGERRKKEENKQNNVNNPPREHLKKGK